MKSIFIVLLMALSNVSNANFFTDPILIWPAAQKQKISTDCYKKIDSQIQAERKKSNFPEMGSLNQGAYSKSGVSYYKGITAHKILLGGLIYNGSDFIFSADVLVPQNSCEHFFEYWKGQIDDPNKCNVIQLEVKLDAGYFAC